MADQEQDTIGTEDELFAEVLSGPAPTSTPEPAGNSEALGTDGQPRDEHGRFAPKPGDAVDTPATQPSPATAEQPPTAVTPPAEGAAPPVKEDRDGWIPAWRVREIREQTEAKAKAATEAETRAARERLAQTQHQMSELQKQIEALKAPKQEPVNLFDDPDRFVGDVEQRLAAQAETFGKQLRTMRLEQNLALANLRHSDVFPKAYEAFTAAVEGGDKAVAARVFNAADPGGTIVAWHREQETLREIGTDPSTYKQKLLEDALSDPVYLAKALERAKAQASRQPAPQGQQPGQPAARPNVNIQLPPSLRTMPGAAAASDGAGIEHLSEAELFDAAIARR